jgi:glucokinase
MDFRVEHAILAVAGPVLHGSVSKTISHLPWELDQVHLQQNLKLKSLELINDLEAIAVAIPNLRSNHLHPLNTGRPEERGSLAVIAPGTGLGEAFLIWDGQQYRPCVSEGGHANFASTTPFESELCCFIQRTFGYASYELVCSGIGNCLKGGGHAVEPAWLTKQLADAPDPTPIIIKAALDVANPPEICTLALKTFISVLGSEAGNLALKVIATGGLYLGGGLSRRILPLLERERNLFMEAFSKKGIMTEMMVNIPVHVITHPQVALLGAAHRML